MLENVKFKEREVNGEEIQKKNGIWKNKSEKWSQKVVGMEMEKMREKEGLKVKNKGDMGLRQGKEVKREEIGRILVKN